MGAYNRPVQREDDKKKVDSADNKAGIFTVLVYRETRSNNYCYEIEGSSVAVDNVKMVTSVSDTAYYQAHDVLVSSLDIVKIISFWLFNGVFTNKTSSKILKSLANT